jgi:hypothetical protein
LPQVSKLSIFTALRFNARNSRDQARVHFLHTQTKSQSASLNPVWDEKWQIQDGLLAAMIQILRLEEHRIQCVCAISHGHRLPREICLALPFSNSDESLQQVKALAEAVIPQLSSLHGQVPGRRPRTLNTKLALLQ